MTEFGKLELVTLLAASQFAMVFLKHVNIRVVVAGEVGKAVVLTFLIQATWLISTAIGVKAVWSGDIPLVIAYLVAGMLGAYFNFKIKTGVNDERK